MGPDGSDTRRRPGPSLGGVFLSEFRCILVTALLLIGGRISMPRERVGQTLHFGDGTSSLIYRETVMRDGTTTAPVTLAVRFRLRLLGSSRLGHALFRFESLFNTILFAGHRGFRSKLWLTDRVTGYYRGVYEWDGAAPARIYAETLRSVLAPWVEPGSFGYLVVEGTDRTSLLTPAAPPEQPDPALWWFPVIPERGAAPVPGRTSAHG